jgi:hypothetical protein
MEGTVISCASASASARGSFGGTKRAVSAVISAIVLGSVVDRSDVLRATAERIAEYLRRDLARRFAGEGRLEPKAAPCELRERIGENERAFGDEKIRQK